MCFLSVHVAEPDMDYSDMWTVRYVTFQPSESSYNITISCPIRPLVDHPQLYTYEWELPNRGISDSNSPNLTVAIKPSFSSSSFHQCEVNIQHSPGVRRRYDGSEIYIGTFGKLLVIYSVCIYTCTLLTALKCFLCTLSLSLSHTHTPLTPKPSFSLHFSFPLSIPLSFLSSSPSPSLHPSLSLSHT